MGAVFVPVRAVTRLAELPPGNAAEVALLGRSNVGKSSLLNALAEAPLARASRTPGRTRALYFFPLDAIAGRRRAPLPPGFLVDCPGYGYARVSRTLAAEWGELMQAYLETRSQLRLCVLLIDAALPAQAPDLDLLRWLRRRRRDVQLVATKWDRLSGNGRALARHRLEHDFGLPPLPVSARTGEGVAALRRAVADALA